MTIATSLRALSILALLSACASTPAPTASADAKPQPTTTWYGGTMTVSSADGATPYGPPQQALVSRTVDPAREQIVEVVVDDGQLRTTILQRMGTTNVFAATDDSKSFHGTVTMRGEGWTISGWSYELIMADGSGTITGTATIDDTGLQTEKYFLAPDGQKKVRIVDKLSPISKAEYDEKLAYLPKK